MEGKYQPRFFFAWVEKKINTGLQSWKQYTASLLLFNTLLFVLGYLILWLQPWMPLNPEGKSFLAPSTLFNTVVSFMTNTDLQHYSGERDFSNFSQLFFCITNFFIAPAIGVSALVAVIRALRGEAQIGNFFLDLWRAVVYLFLPLAFVFALVFLQQGSPMTFKTQIPVSTLEQGSMGFTDTGTAKSQTIALGPVAAFESIKLLGTNGGGFYNTNSAHPFENPSDISNFFSALAMLLFPLALLLMYGQMLGQARHGWVIFSVMMTLLSMIIVGVIMFDSLKPNPAFIGHSSKTFQIIDSFSLKQFQLTLPEVKGLPVDQSLGNLEGKEVRFGRSGSSTFAAITASMGCGAINAEMDSLNPLAGLFPMIGLWLNCFFGGAGVGVINILLFIIIGIFIAGMMVGRTPEYLGRKIEGREIKLAILALLVHPLLVLIPTGSAVATAWGMNAINNPAAHGFSQVLYQFSSASANNGSAFDGLIISEIWNVVTAFTMLFSRFMPIIAAIALAASIGSKKMSPVTLGTLKVDTVTFGVFLFATIVIMGALLYLPAAVLGPISEHLGPIPFGR